MAAFYHARKILRSEAIREQGYVNPEQVSPKTVDVSHDISGVSESAIIRSFEFVEPEDIDESDAYQHVIGVGCTASLATDRQKMGEHRVHIAVQTLQQTIQFSLQLQKDARTRWEEERLVADLILNAVETARREAEHHSHAMPPNFSGTGEVSCPAFAESISGNYPMVEQIPLNLKPGEIIQGELAVGSPLLVNLFFGKLGAVLWADDEIRHSVAHEDIISSTAPFNTRAEFTQAVFPGSFSPIHKGHLEMINVAEQRLQGKIVLEMSVQNVDKPPFDYIDLKHRLAHIRATNPKQTVWLTQTPLFVHKAELFRGTSFVVGADTIKRLPTCGFIMKTSINFTRFYGRWHFIIAGFWSLPGNQSQAWNRWTRWRFPTCCVASAMKFPHRSSRWTFRRVICGARKSHNVCPSLCPLYEIKMDAHHQFHPRVSSPAAGVPPARKMSKPMLSVRNR